jgi:hypothetical protein
MKQKSFNSQSGASIIEILIVLCLALIISTVALLQLQTSKTDVERQRIAREFKIYLERARFDSVKRRAVDVNDMSRITLNSSSAFTAAYDLNENGKLDTTDVRQVDFSQRSSTQIIVSNTLNYPVTILFDQRGQIIAKDGLNNDVIPVFTICSKNCTATSQSNEDLTVLSVSSTGTVAVLRGGQTPSTLPTPAITNSTPIFNCYMLLANTNSTSCINN